MVEFKHILAPTDMSEESRPALAHAAAVASWYGASLSLLHVVPTFDAVQMTPGTLGDSVQVVYPSTREEVIATMQRQVEAAGLASAAPYLMAEAGSPADTIVDQAISMPADLIVIGTHGRSGFNRLLHGSTAEQVLHRSPCPVLTVPPHSTSAHADARFKRILCAMDFSPAAMQALGFALDLGRKSRGLVMVQHALEWLADEEPRVHEHFNVSEYRTYLLNDARARLDEVLAAEDRTDVDVQPVVSTGRAYREILREAEASAADLIVMGAQGRGGLGQALTGSATNQVLRAATCPVLTVRGA
jgi:nucleotide-binding universal stress UspA family protein